MIHWTDKNQLKEQREENLDRICWWVIGVIALYVGAHLAFQAYMWNWPA